MRDSKENGKVITLKSGRSFSRFDGGNNNHGDPLTGISASQTEKAIEVPETGNFGLNPAPAGRERNNQRLNVVVVRS